MGVKDLWSVLSPSCEKKSLWELEGLNIAIDLSSWIVDSQNIGENSVMNMYLRNLFFRTSYLLLLGVKPVFVLEGKAPELKHDTIARRQDNVKGKEPKSYTIASKGKSGNRGRLNVLQKRCEELLLSMGVRCYRSEGEAEALCSRLNEIGEVDAVISQDSDCFLYGAQVVLRNFTMSPSYTCDMYTMENIKQKLDLGRQKLLALSLLCGCDYETGVQGVGKQSALKFLATVSDDQVIDRLRSWRSDHILKNDINISQISLEEKLERNIYKKATLDPTFPSEEVIAEFLTARNFDLPSFNWIKPSPANFMTIADRYLAWEEDYILVKFMPLVTRWHLLHNGSFTGLTLERIVKKRSLRSVSSYELRWQHDSFGELTTVEPEHLVAKVYPELHEAFIKSKEKPKKGKMGRKKKTQNPDSENVEMLLEKLDINGPTTKQPNKKRGVQKGLQTLDRFLLKESNTKGSCEGNNDPVILHSTPIKKPELAISCHYLSDNSDVMSPLHNKTRTEVPADNYELSMNYKSFADLSVESAAFDLSNIVNSIVTRTHNPALNIWTRRQT